jgi:predicted 2-oxoglutarate/Fe(II)-dependent dioxygenase YbiX/peroxiredoxin
MSTAAPPRAALLEPGEPVPWFRAAALDGNPDYAFESAAGRAMLILLFGSAGEEAPAAALRLVSANRDLFDDVTACFFGVTVDPQDAAKKRIAQSLPGIRFFLDLDLKVSRLFGAIVEETPLNYAPHWLLADRTMRVVERFALDAGEAALAGLRALAEAPSQPDSAPVLIVPRILEPPMCRHLIDLYEAEGGTESGFMRQVNEKTVMVSDPAHKIRRDYTIRDQALQRQLAVRVGRRLAPMIRRAFQFEPTRMERYIIGCYSAGAGHFRPHRDNTTTGTAHRRFAVTINLNADDYEGGDLCFPEYGPRTYRPPTGGAVVFSCSLQHEATAVTRGTRYAFLPFLYDEAAARQREENNRFLDESLTPYKAG